MPMFERPPAWTVLAEAITSRRAVRARYHGKERLLCPHALGWKNGRATVLSYQAGGATSEGPLPSNPAQRWRSMFVDEIDDAEITDEAWMTADNYSHDSNCLDHVELLVQRSPTRATGRA